MRGFLPADPWVWLRPLDIELLRVPFEFPNDWMPLNLAYAKSDAVIAERQIELVPDLSLLPSNLVQRPSPSTRIILSLLKIFIVRDRISPVQSL